MINKVLGIIINEMPYQESSKILLVLTKEYGIISLLSKGCRKYTSKLSSGSKTLNIAIFHFIYKKDKLIVLRDIDVVEQLNNIKNDISRISYVSYVTKLTKLVSEVHYHSDIFDIFYNYLLKVESNMDYITMTLIIEFKYLLFLGIKPITTQCVKCGNISDIVTISVDDYGYICNNCVSSEYIFNPKTLKLIDIFLNIELANLNKISINISIIKELEDFVSMYYYKHSGLHINKIKFIEILNRI